MKSIIILAVCAVLCSAQAKPADDVESRFATIGFIQYQLKGLISFIDSKLQPAVNDVIKRTENAADEIEDSASEAEYNNENTKKTVLSYLEEIERDVESFRNKGIDVSECNGNQQTVRDMVQTEVSRTQKCISELLIDSEEIAQKPQETAEEALEVLEKNRVKANGCVDDLDRLSVQQALNASRCLIEAKLEADLKWASVHPLLNADLRKLENLVEIFPSKLDECSWSAMENYYTSKAKDAVTIAKSCILNKVKSNLEYNL
ncbi:hypothetical protein TKK_0006700 [Trichogramma kaykai]